MELEFIGYVCGVNLPWIGCQTVRNDKVEKHCQVRFKGTWNYASVDLLHSVFKTGHVGLMTALRQILRADCHAYWDAKDPLPILISSIGDVKKIILHLEKAL